MTIRAPVYANRSVKKLPVVQDPPNLLLTILTAVAASPFYQTDWPNPVRIKSLLYDFYQNIIGTTLEIVPLFRIPASTMNPVSRVVRAESIWIQNLLETTLGDTGRNRGFTRNVGRMLNAR